MTDRRGDVENLTVFVIARRLDIIARSAPLAVASSLASIVIMLIAFRQSAYYPAILAWGIIAAAVSLAGLGSSLTRIDGRPSAANLARMVRISRVLLALSSLVWSVGILGLSQVAVGIETAVVGVVGTAIYVGVLLVHRSMPRLAYFHIVLLGGVLSASAWITMGLEAYPVILVLTIYALTLITAVARMERALIDFVKVEVERTEASETVRMLLDDYQEHSSDWLWTVDAGGHLREVSERFGDACDRRAEELEGAALVALLLADEGRAKLEQAIAGGRAFRDLVVSLPVGESIRQWKLSARTHSDGRLSGVARDITADRRNEERVAFMAHFDNLTGLANRYLFNERLRKSLSPESRLNGNVVMFYLDLDDFKAINDTRGHLVGDSLLREVGARLESEVRSSDTVARLGGDEFAILMETRAGDGLLIERAHRFLSVVRQPYTIDGQTYRISTSVGVARCAEGECDADELMRRADLALYAAKSKGRDNFAMFEAQLDRAARSRREMEIDLAEALASGEFRLHYQPIVDLETGQVTAIEALLRWHHPRRGLVSPANFLPVAEATGLIVPIGEWVIRQALLEMSTRDTNIRLSINLSPTQVKDPGLLGIIAQMLHTTNINPKQVEFEITENVLMEAGETNLVILQQLHDLGVGIALDDFGTGYSSLSYLRRFPFDRLKIDRHFVEHVDTDADARAIVASVAQLALTLGMDTTAEGVERLDQLEALRELGIDEAQGFFISKPEPGDRIDLAAVEESRGREGTSGVLDYRRARAKALRRRSHSASA